MNSRNFKILTGGWSLIILFLTLKPNKGGEVFWLLQIEGMDKVAHFGLFFILAILTYPAFVFVKKSFKRQILISIIYGILISILTEYGQQFVQGRSSDWLDFLADITGVFFGIFVARLVLFRNVVF